VLKLRFWNTPLGLHIRLCGSLLLVTFSVEKDIKKRPLFRTRRCNDDDDNLAITRASNRPPCRLNESRTGFNARDR